jgi:hypothetical protein
MILAHHQSSGDGSVLPKYLHILTLAQTLADTAYGGMSQAIPSGARACWINSDNDPVSQTVDMCATLAQGFIAMKAELHQTCTGTNHGRGPPKQAPDAALSNHCCKAVPRRSCYQGTCDTCGQWGHPANACNKVGAWAILRRYHQDWANAAAIEDAERAWMEKNKPFLRNVDDTPRKVFTTYCKWMGIAEEQLIDEIDWDFFSDDKTEE